MRLSRRSQLSPLTVERKMAAMLCRIREMWRDNILLMRHENLRKAKKNLTSVAEEAEEADLKPGEGNTESEVTKDDTDGDISKSVDSESRKSRMLGEGERDITKENGEDATKTEETNNDEKNEREFGVNTEDKAKYGDQRVEVTSHETGSEVEFCRNPLNYWEM